MRDAVPGDARAIAGVHVASWRAAYAGLMPDTVLAGLSVEERTASWTRLLAEPGQHTLVVEAEEVVGLREDRGRPRRRGARRGPVRQGVSGSLNPAWDSTNPRPA